MTPTFVTSLRFIPPPAVLIEFHAAALRNASWLPSADKELIAAYVFGLNDCKYCYGVHTETAKAVGVEEGLIEQLLADLDSAPVQCKLRPLLRSARKLTLEAARMTTMRTRFSPRAGARPNCTTRC